MLIDNLSRKKPDDQQLIQKMEKEIAELKSSLEQATTLFSQTLSIKLQYEEMIVGLLKNEETG